jgi:Multicopper oxidase
VTEVVELADGELFEMSIEPVAKELGEHTVRMLGYNGSVPGPTLRVPEGGEIQVKVENSGDLDATVHWHGLRLDNAYDGTHETQKPMAIGESFTYRVHCPDPGAYWYHPHIREDYGQELGLYGNLIVVPADPDYWAPAHREVAVTLWVCSLTCQSPCRAAIGGAGCAAVEGFGCRALARDAIWSAMKAASAPTNPSSAEPRVHCHCSPSV